MPGIYAHRYDPEDDRCRCGGEIVFWDQFGTYGCEMQPLPDGQQFWLLDIAQRQDDIDRVNEQIEQIKQALEDLRYSYAWRREGL